MPRHWGLVRLVAILAAVSAVTAAQPAPLRIVVMEGEGAIHYIGERAVKAPVVRVEDDDGRPLPRVTVTFVLPDMGAGGFFSNGGATFATTTDARGIAAAEAFRPNNIAGRFSIRVMAVRAGRTATAAVTQINAAPEIAPRRSARKKFVILGLAAGAAAGVIFALRSGDDSPVRVPGGAPVITPGSPIFGPPR